MTKKLKNVREWWLITENINKKPKTLKRNQTEISELENIISETIKHTNICIMGVPKEQEKKKGTERISQKIIVKNFPNLVRNNLHRQEVQQTTSRIKSKWSIPRHITHKLLKDEEYERSKKEGTHHVQGMLNWFSLITRKAESSG